MLYILIATLTYAVTIMFATAANRMISSNLVSAVVNIISVVIPVLIVLPHLNKKVIENGKYGLLFALCAGIGIGIYTLALNKSYSVNKVALVSPLVFGGAIVLTAILSYFIFKEKLPPVHIAGLAIVILGLLTIIYSAATGK